MNTYGKQERKTLAIFVAVCGVETSRLARTRACSCSRRVSPLKERGSVFSAISKQELPPFKKILALWHVGHIGRHDTEISVFEWSTGVLATFYWSGVE